VILQDAFTVEPWNLRETHLDLDLLAQAESVFALANGHVGWRANLDEGEPHGLPGSYLNGVYESRPLPYAESAYGLPETGQEMINVTNGKLIRLFVDDEPFDVRYGELRSHERLLDFRTGVLNRRAEWVSPAGRPVRVSSVRLVSFTQRAVAAICYEVEPLDSQARIVVQSELLTNEQLPSAEADPRVPAAPADPLSREYGNASGTAVMLVHKTKRSGLRVGAAMDHLIDGPAPVRVESRVLEDSGLVTVATALQPGQKLRVIKFVGYGWSADRSLPVSRTRCLALPDTPPRGPATVSFPTEGAFRSSDRRARAPTRRSGSDGKFGDAEGEVQVPHPVVGEAHRDHARSFQPVRHFQAADVQRAQPEALDERLHTCLGLRIIASDEDVGTALLQDMAEDGVERLHHAGAGRGRLGDFLRDRGLLAVG
jgi:Glycosyl hydrolase family 65, N-terminal domain